MLVDATSRRDINTVHKSHLSNKLIELPSYQLFHYVNQFEIKKKTKHMTMLTNSAIRSYSLNCSKFSKIPVLSWGFQIDFRFL